ncbi:MAG: hypothetical protein GXY86_05700 [Firmicutes bacterium]|nr:hypothetical protein [Bacillota bacterium]
MFKCWNCQGTGLIQFEGEDLDYGTMTFGDDCPICHGQPWLMILAKKLIKATGGKIKLLYSSEVFGLIICSIIITIIFFGLVLIL